MFQVFAGRAGSYDVYQSDAYQILFLLPFFTVLREKFRLEPSNVGVAKGGTALLECAPPKGSPTPTIFWKKNGKDINTEKMER